MHVYVFLGHCVCVLHLGLWCWPYKGVNGNHIKKKKVTITSQLTKTAIEDSELVFWLIAIQETI